MTSEVAAVEVANSEDEEDLPVSQSPDLVLHVPEEVLAAADSG